MNQYMQSKIQDLLNQSAEELSSTVGGIVGTELEEPLCAISGVTAQRLAELANGDHCTPQEMLAVYATAEYLVYPVLYPKTAYPSYGFPLTQGGEHPFRCEALTDRLLDETGLPSVLKRRNRWMSGVVECVMEDSKFCQNLTHRAEMEDTDSFLRSYHFFLDGSTLCSEYMSDFLDHYIARLDAPGMPKQIVIPQMVVDRIQELVENPSEEQNVLINAAGGQEQMRRIQAADMLSVRGEKGESTLLSTFFSALARCKPTQKIVLLTQDETLAKSINLLNVSGVEGSDILIAFLGEGGYPVLWFDNKEEVSNQQVSLRMENVPDRAAVLALEDVFHMKRDENVDPEATETQDEEAFNALSEALKSMEASSAQTVAGPAADIALADPASEEIVQVDMDLPELRISELPDLASSPENSGNLEDDPGDLSGDLEDDPDDLSGDLEDDPGDLSGDLEDDPGDEDGDLEDDPDDEDGGNDDETEGNDISSAEEAELNMLTRKLQGTLEAISSEKAEVSSESESPVYQTLRLEPVEEDEKWQNLP